MKNFISLLLLFIGLSVVTLAHEPKNHDSDFHNEIKTEMVLPSIDLDFKVAIYLPLDVYAPIGQEIDYSCEKTESGFTRLQEKPPLQKKQTESKARKKWIWHVHRELSTNLHSKRLIV